ncbi:DUF4173 domain-containing protein [Nocardioides panacisoli]|uniref:DUF4153 domain-containing protein n=1 Tax=Nocardioides panacisoli TaxID=627624 RepID=UPI001C63AF9A|nr:DUF4153 domain-containing protein [Nocardioides panacisoli]QYJ05686.1 DUF4173 domain-containing protein [Nocardioides panacisoli]
MTSTPLAPLRSIKLKLGLLVAASVTVAALVGVLGRASGVPLWLGIPVAIALALAVTQLLAVGMVAPLREMTAAARRMATGDYTVRVTATSRDEVGELAHTFNAMAADLADVDRQRRALVANVSHELRTPLAGLRALLENVVDGVDDGVDSVPAALARAERMSDLVEDLLDLAREDAGRAAFSPQPVRLDALVTDAVEEVSALGRDVAFAVDVSPDLVVHADPDRLRQLVTNLLDNASRHSPSDGTVHVDVETSDEHYRLSVHDEGPGLPAADRERVFEPFGTARTAGTTDATGGTGLGLAIARWVSDLHGGSIAFHDPATGTGALVRVDLPLRPTGRPGPVPDHEESPVPTTASPPPPAAPEQAVTPVASPGLLEDFFGSLWPDRTAARLPVLLAALGVGVLAAIVLPFRDAGVGTTLVLLAAGTAILTASRRRREPFTLLCAALCVLLAVATSVRDADWVLVLCVLLGGLLTAVGVAGGRTVSGFAAAAVAVPLAGVRGLPWLGRTLRVLTGGGHGAALLRTTVWSLLALLVFGALFATADALLAEWVTALLPDLSAQTVVLRAFLTVAVGGVVLAASYLALNPPDVDRMPTDVPPVSRRYEWLVPVMVVNAVFAAFLLAQATVVFGGHGHLQRTTGLTYAEYVHQGFGQLTVATALTLLVTWAAARKAPRGTAPDRGWLRGALGLLGVQTLVVVASALHRMDLYQEAYGFTELRLLVTAFEGWVGVLVVAMLVAGVGLRARWLPRFALVTGTVALLGIVALNPDAWIAERNLDRYAETGRVDWPYLQGLSQDAVPTLVEELPDDLEDCALAGRVRDRDDWLEWNLGRSRAAAYLPATRQVVPGRDSDCPDGTGLP